MPNFYYVKKGGLAAGDAGRATTARTTSFAAMGASAYYDSIFDVGGGAVPTTPIASGGIILCSNLHDKDYAAYTALGVVGGVRIYSVDDADASAYLRGAWERAPGIDFAGPSTGSWSFCKGVSFESSAHMTLVGARESDVYIEDCELFSSGAGAYSIALFSGDGCVANLHNVDIRYTNAGSYIYGANAVLVKMVGGKVLTNQTTLIIAAGSGGLTLLAEDWDISACTGNLTNFGASSLDNTQARLDRCKLGTGLSATSAATKKSLSGAGIFLVSCDTGDGYYRQDHTLETGQVATETAIYRTAGATYDGTNYMSLEMVNDPTASVVRPVEVEVFNGWIDTAEYTTNITFKIHFAIDGSAVALDSDEFYIRVEHADGLDSSLGVVVSSEPDHIPLAAGTAPTTETALWTGLGGTNKQMSVSKTIPIGATAGTIASGVVRVTAVSTNASQTVFVCPQAEIS